MVQDREGREVALTDIRWQHIVTRHAELATRQDEVLLTVAMPDFVTVDPETGFEQSYREIQDDTNRRPMWMKVVILYGQIGGSVILTAHRTHRVRPREVQRWP